jgi:predicted metalloprotease with PDZ domain
MKLHAFVISGRVGVFIGLVACTSFAAKAADGGADPIRYTVTFPEAEKHRARVEAVIPSEKKDSIEIFMPVWSPGFYRLEDHARNVEALEARAPDGMKLPVESTRKNRWRITTGGNTKVVVAYDLKCEGRSVTTNWVDEHLAVLNGAPTFATLAGSAKRPHEVRLELVPTWKQSMTALEPASDGLANHYRADDYDTLVDSPIVAGTPSVHEFQVEGSRHFLADIGEFGQWDGQRAARDLEKIVRETRVFWGWLPFQKYFFLNVFRRGGGGLEHRNSTLLTASPARLAASGPDFRWYSFVSHEYFHAFNVKRLRPVELGPFDYENPPHTSSLWISEGLTTYFGELIVIRAGLGKTDDFLASMSSHIGQLQTAPGRLVQTLEQASLDVWSSGTSGVGRDRASTVSYYVKGPVVGFLLDARIRRLTADKQSFDDVMRLAYKRYSGERGFTAEEFRKTAEEIAGVDLKEWFRRALASTEELDYAEALDWFGLRFAAVEEPVQKAADEAAGKPPDRPSIKTSEKAASDAAAPQAKQRGDEARKRWRLEVRPDATEAQRAHLRALLKPAAMRKGYAEHGN